MTKKGKVLKAVQKVKPKAVTVPDKKAPEKINPKQKKKDSTGWQDELGTELAAYGLRVKQVVGDGNCFFRAVADQLGNSPDGDHLTLRASTMAFMQGHRTDFEPFLEEDEECGHYVQRMSREGTWAGQQELVALARDLRLRLRVYQAGQPSWVLAPDFPDFPKDAPEIHLSYHDGAHYNSVRRADDFGEGAPSPIALGARSAAPAAPADRSFGAREEERVAQEAGCFHDRAAVRAALEAASGRVAQAVEVLVERLASEAASGAAEAPPQAAQASAADSASSPHPAHLLGPGGAAEQHAVNERAGAGAAALPSPAAPPQTQAAAHREPECMRDCAAPAVPDTATAPGASSVPGSRPTGPAAAALSGLPKSQCSICQQCVTTLACAPLAVPGAHQAGNSSCSLAGGEAETVGGVAQCGVNSISGAALSPEGSSTAASSAALPVQETGQPAAENTALAERSNGAAPAQITGGPAEPASAAAVSCAAAQNPGSAGSPTLHPGPGGKPVAPRPKAKAPPRNRPCPCASGKRYKECCGPVAAAAARRVIAAPAPAEPGRQMATLYV